VGDAECTGLVGRARRKSSEAIGRGWLAKLRRPMAQRRANLSPSISISMQSGIGCAVGNIQSLSLLAHEWLLEPVCARQEGGVWVESGGMDKVGRARVREEMAERPQRAAVFVVLRDVFFCFEG
jgi:hypothetical protein